MSHWWDVAFTVGLLTVVILVRLGLEWLYRRDL